ncbi:helix-turn-helix domain-containing protein [Pelagicoccus sp. SDUM812002]|uniref:helix-turn-helix domain-containing protein n=1 Tax=Pelagicoccus sp. SDUM812002 TaxID=3041266 RepID=UPI00280F3501|nr:helix-turn-helix domain-containing protein [Pelagicoccus sp. SDUM812002]MDQ8186139.1 helix-turn-helix domain-containing protein [Pelagicoccus sp. SDUM812002]
MDEQQIMNCGERIKLERLKRSWTQEQLAERSGTSTRTVQRIERGQDPSLATLRLLADALAIEVEELSGAGRRNHFPALWSKQLKVTTVGFFVFIYSVSALMLWLTDAFRQEREGLVVLGLLFPIGISVFCMMASVGGYSVKGGLLMIHRLGWSMKYPLTELSEVRVVPHAMMGAMKVVGFEGVFGSIGLFRNGVLGFFRAYVTDKGKTVVLAFGKKRIVVSPDDPEAFKQAITAAGELLEPNGLDA